MTNPLTNPLITSLKTQMAALDELGPIQPEVVPTMERVFRTAIDTAIVLAEQRETLFTEVIALKALLADAKDMLVDVAQDFDVLPITEDLVNRIREALNG